MFKLGYSALTLVFSLSVNAQQVDWDKVNSQTVLSVIAQQNPDQNDSFSTVIQVGDFNNTELSLNAKTNISVMQAGDYNTLYFINSFTDTETKATVAAQGNNNIIDITGSNSISDGMEIKVKGDNKTIFMRNY
ncbi:hypothetical protein [Chryseobacterium sp. JUb7]|uniref:hypothetical protein n=1 Tax=Chryseobacterium sp. JUb7 TaxID=2940599 RepID=UPI0021671B14|nr:hypothetical protein [Chryseobacterium sp. JUb7]MCS3529792.1 hypothetical protein [Chryseobacterium sp. JUb7]